MVRRREPQKLQQQRVCLSTITILHLLFCVLLDRIESGEADGGELLERSPAREHREEEWALRLAEAEEGMVSSCFFFDRMDGGPHACKAGVIFGCETCWCVRPRLKWMGACFRFGRDFCVASRTVFLACW